MVLIGASVANLATHIGQDGLVAIRRSYCRRSAGALRGHNV